MKSSVRGPGAVSGPGEGSPACVRARARVCARPRPGGAPGAGPPEGRKFLKLCLFELSLLPPGNLPAGRIPGPGAEMKISGPESFSKMPNGVPVGTGRPRRNFLPSESGRSPFNLRPEPKVLKVELFELCLLPPGRP